MFKNLSLSIHFWLTLWKAEKQIRKEQKKK